MNSILRFPQVYRYFTSVIGGTFKEQYIREYLQPKPGDRILDIGCGPGDFLSYLPEVNYLGIDIDPGYIKAAQLRYGKLGEFRCESATETVLREPATFDLVMANGVLHHLDDGEALTVLKLAKQALKSNGRMVTHDGAFLVGQSSISWLLLKMDRGRYVRTQEQYLQLARSVFSNVQPVIRQDLLRLPYTHSIMTCRP